MAIQVARRNGRSAWVNIVKPTTAEHEVALLKCLEEAQEQLDEMEPVEDVVLAAVQDLELHLKGGYTGEVVLANIDYVLQYLYDTFALRIRRSDIVESSDEFVRFGEFEELWTGDEDGEPFETNWNNVQSMLRMFPVTFVPLEADDVPFEVNDGDVDEEPAEPIRQTWEVTGPETTAEAELVVREDWDGMNESCPECGGTEFDHFHMEGGDYGQTTNGAVILRTDYGASKQTLLTVCKPCGAVLHKHPAADLLINWKDVTNLDALIRP